MTDDYTRGQPDWSRGGARTFTGAGGSDYELGSRLWWPLSQVYDGEVHFWDDFEAGVLHWNYDTSGSGSGLQLDTVQANSGEQSVKLIAPAGDGEYSAISKGIVAPISSLIGMGAFVQAEYNVGEAFLVLQGNYDDYYSIYQLRYTFSTGDISIRTSGGWTSVGSAPGLRQYTFQFGWMQLVVDLENRKYKSVTVGSERVLLDVDSYATGAQVYANQLELIVEYDNTEESVRSLWVDDVIVTRNVQLPTE